MSDLLVDAKGGIRLDPGEVHQEGWPMTELHVEPRPFPGAPPAAPRDLAGAADSALAAARRALAAGPPPEHPADCRCSVWCRDEWVYADHAIGPCETCGEPCRSTDPEGRRRHPTCGEPA